MKTNAQLPIRRIESMLERLAIGNSVVERVRRETRSMAVAHDWQAAADFAV